MAPERPPEARHGGAKLHEGASPQGERPSGAEGNRTPGLDSAIVALYQLSYSPKDHPSVSAAARPAPSRDQPVCGK